MAISVPNQWAGTFNQIVSFGTTPPDLQSVIVPLNSGASNVGGGTGIPTAGNWLVTLVAMNERSTASGFTVGVGDDIHSFWRPGDETASNWAVSTATAQTRAAAWYTANLARVPGNVYVAPNGAFDSLAVLVVEIAGLGPWDTVAGISTNYAAAATSLSLSLGAPSAQALVIGMVSGDSTTAGQAFLPASWTGLHTTTVTNGTDHTTDSVLTAAYIVTSGSVSVSGTATSAEDLSGVLLSVLTSASSPIPANQNPGWPLVKFEAAFGGGFQTPQDKLTWTDLSTRLWSWDETTGVQYQLGEVLATDLDLELDNNDNLLSTDNPAALFYTAAGANWHPQDAFYNNQVLANTPLAWWKLNDAAGAASAADSSGNAHSATATSVTFGNANQAVISDNSASFASGSSSHALSTYNPALSAVTVEGWVNLNSLSQSGNPLLMANSNTTSDHKGFTLGLTGTTPQVTFGNNTTSATVNAAAALPASGWTYLAGTWDGTTVTLYVNGVLQGTAALSGTMPAGTTAIGVGYNSTTSAGFMNGLLAECAVYGTALTAAQVVAHYTAGPVGAGVPLRIRAAVGTMAGVTTNRWYVIQRNAEQWPQRITQGSWRRYAPVTATDIWSVMSSSGPSPYRGEVQLDGPYATWAMDDQPLAGGVLPTSLRNSAPGNTNVLNIISSPNGLGPLNAYDTNGSTTGAVPAPPYTFGFQFGLSVYSVGQAQGWMYGDPQSSPQSSVSGNPVTASPGSAAWQTTGQAGNTGANGWFLSSNDAAFPPLSGGVTVGCWFNYLYAGTQIADPSASTLIIAQQPQSPLSLFALTTGSNPVAILQLDTSGHLSLITYVGSTPTSHSVYTTSDLRDQSWHYYTVTLTTTTWAVYVDGGITAKASGSVSAMTSAWTWIVANGDMGNTAGGGTTASIQHSGNVSIAHLAVYPAVLTAWQVLGQYCAAITGFGLIPAPANITYAILAQNAAGGTTPTPDGLVPTGTYGAAPFTFSTVIVARAGTSTSGPSAWVAQGANTSPGGAGDTVCLTWTGLAASFAVYTNASIKSETQASITAGTAEDYSSGYGNTAVGYGVAHTAAGSGASPPASASSIGDTVQQRLERILGFGNVTYPGRCIDPASLLVQAGTDIGGQQAGANLVNIAGSDSGLLYIDNLGSICYLQRSHLATQYSSPAWTIGPAGNPYYPDFHFTSDPHRLWNAILIQPFSPDGATLADLTPAQSVQVNASQAQYGAQPKQVTSYLQSTAEMQNQANWLFANFGALQLRVENVRIDAAPNPAFWTQVLGVNVGDVASIQNWQPGGGANTGIFRVSRVRRHIEFGGQDGEVSGSVVLTADWEPPSYWT